MATSETRVVCKVRDIGGDSRGGDCETTKRAGGAARVACGGGDAGRGAGFCTTWIE